MGKKANPNPDFEPIDDEKPTEKPNVVSALVDDVTEVLDDAVDYAGNMVGSDKGAKIVGGAAVGALAAIVLPIGLIGGAILGAGYAAMRNRDK